MRNTYSKLLILLLTFTSCDSNSFHVKKRLPEKSVESVYEKLGTIHIVPLGPVSNKILNEVKNSITQFYGRPVEILQPQKPKGNLRRTPQSRHSADSILKYYRSDHETIVVTSFDITIYDTARKADWGIFGWGYYPPGKTCVISCYPRRLGRDVSEKVLLSRIRKVAIHEVGHNLDLHHCQKDVTCVMHAADKKATQVDIEKEMFCVSCKKELLKKL
jgi:archaemetzincin